MIVGIWYLKRALPEITTEVSRATGSRAPQGPLARGGVVAEAAAMASASAIVERRACEVGGRACGTRHYGAMLPSWVESLHTMTPLGQAASSSSSL